MFAHNSVETQQDNLIVILTPYVVSNSEKLSQLQKDLGMLENLQQKYNLEVFQNIEKQGFNTDAKEEDKNNSDKVKAMNQAQIQEIE